MVADRDGFVSFGIAQSFNAPTILEYAERLGLHDIREWVTVDALQSFLDMEKWIAYAATLETPESDIVGIAVMGIEEEGRLWIETLVTDPRYRRKGIATELCNSMVEYGRRHGFRVIFVDLDDDNIPAYRFYKQFGFENAGRISRYYYDSSTAIILAKNLPED
ncbi:MAG: GNAT family N-acetyltransferase [Candidatus Thorarchaeota archaeon]